MAELVFLRLPINPEEGFPQAFLLNFLGATFQIGLYVNLREDTPPNAAGLYELPMEGAFMVLTLARRGPGGMAALLRRKLITGRVETAGELLLRFDRMAVAPSNLNGVGRYGSVVEGRVAARWAS